MNKILTSVVFALLLLCSKPLFADRFLVEGKIGNFRPFSRVLRDLYTDSWADYYFEVSYSPFDSRDCGWWRNFFVWSSYNYIFNHGRTKDGIEDSEINVQLHNVSAGLKYLLPMPAHFGAYWSVGARYTFLRIENKDPNVDPHERANGFGEVFGFGLLFNPYKWVLVDLFTNLNLRCFGENHFAKENEIEQPKSVDISGLTIGIGLGFCF